MKIATKKKILVFIDWFLPGYRAGGPIRSCANMIEHLKDEFDFSVITRDSDYCETISYPGIISNTWNILPNGIKVFYFSSDKLNASEIKKIIEQEDFDFVYLNGIYSYPFTILPLRILKKKNKKVVVAVRGMLAESAIAQKQFKKRVFLYFARMMNLFGGITFQASTEKEKEEVKKYFGVHSLVKIAPNLPRKQLVKNVLSQKKFAGKLRLVNVARISPEKNLKYALEVLREVKGNVVFDFYGPVYNNDYWNECKKIITKLPVNIIASYKGSVDGSKIAEILSDYQFMFMPSLGENFGHIIIESFACGLPVIISDQTPWRNLEKEKAGWDIPLSEKEKFIEAVEQCAEMNQDEYLKFSSSAKKIVSALLDDSEIIAQNKSLFV
ncbi:MAG: glycosyltransferase family 4 protein [Bacteroidota bacterium]